MSITKTKLLKSLFLFFKFNTIQILNWLVTRQQYLGMPGGRFKNVYELLTLRAL